MIKLGLLREGKNPPDNRVALTPDQCKWLHGRWPGLQIVAQTSPGRCFSDAEYRAAGISIQEDMSDCQLLLGIKEVPVDWLLPGKTYLFFSHTRKKQAYNQHLFRTILDRKITLIDYECLEHEDGQRILGFGFFAGVVGAHNGVMAYGNRSGLYTLERVHKQHSFHKLIHTYFGLRLPDIKIAVTGSGRVAHGIIEIMNLLGVLEVEPDVYLQRQFTYPVFTQLKGPELYVNRHSGKYNREEFHAVPDQYVCRFLPYAQQTDILMNGIYWDNNMPRLFEKGDINDKFTIQTIADITDDAGGSVPINLGDQSIADPVYGVDRGSFEKTAPYLKGSIDVMAVGNLPNELPRDASRYFGEQLIKYVMEDLLEPSTGLIERATMVKEGKLMRRYNYLEDYAK